MRVITKRGAISLAVGVAATVLVSLVPYQYCMDGRGRGWPFAIVHPAHLMVRPGSQLPTRGDEVFSILLMSPTARMLPSGLSYPPEINVLAIVGDIVVWSLAGYCIVRWLYRRKLATQPEPSRNPPPT